MFKELLLQWQTHRGLTSPPSEAGIRLFATLGPLGARRLRGAFDIEPNAENRAAAALTASLT